jgi:hypothetical protein
MIEPLSGRTKELQAKRREKLKVGVGLLAVHTNLRAQMFNLTLTQRQDC